MADFNIALQELLTFEGGYSNNPADSGGETYAGISRRWNPTWLGWSFVDAARKNITNIVTLNAFLLHDVNLQTAVAAFYKQKYWNFDTIPYQSVANKMFEMEINFGAGSAVRIIQQALVRLGARLNLDGSLGPSTLAAIQTQKEPDLLHGLRAYSALARYHLVASNPDQVQFLEGWLWRDTA